MINSCPCEQASRNFFHAMDMTHKQPGEVKFVGSLGPLSDLQRWERMVHIMDNSANERSATETSGLGYTIRMLWRSKLLIVLTIGLGYLCVASVQWPGQLEAKLATRSVEVGDLWNQIRNLPPFDWAAEICRLGQESRLDEAILIGEEALRIVDGYDQIYSKPLMGG